MLLMATLKKTTDPGGDADVAKRFTDSEKWKRPWYRTMTPRVREFWNYITDNCDYAGVWVEDYELASYCLGFPVSPADLSALGEKAVRVDGDKVLIPSFIKFQYGELNPTNKAHQGVLKQLRAHGVSWPEIVDKPKAPCGQVGIPLGSPMHGAKEQEQKQEQKQEQEEGGVGETSALSPRRQAGGEALADQIRQASETWLDTLSHFGMGRTNLLAAEQDALGRAIQTYTLTAVKCALIGMRHQKKGPDWDPAQFVSLRFALDPKNFQRLMNLGVLAHNKMPKGAA